MTAGRGAPGAAVTVNKLVKKYSKNMPAAVDEISFTVAEGEVFGLLGPNGAGKTTTIGVLTTRVKPTSGTAMVCGVDVGTNPAAACRVLGVVPQQNNLDRSLNIRQNLLYHAAYHGIGRKDREQRADQVLELMGLTDHGKQRADMVSGGQAQRIMIGRALMHGPRVLFLDEPATGLDPQSRLFVHERVQHLRTLGVTVVVTTHDMEEAEKLCDRVGIVDHGKMLALDTPSALTRSLQGQTTVTVSVNLNGVTAEKVQVALDNLTNIERVERITKSAGGGGMFGGPFGFDPPGGPPSSNGGAEEKSKPKKNGVAANATPSKQGNPGAPPPPLPHQARRDPVMPESLANAVTEQIPRIGVSGWPDPSNLHWEGTLPKIAYPPPGQSAPLDEAEAEADFRLYTIADPAQILPDLLRVTGGFGCSVTDISLGTPSLEDVFVHLTGRDLR